MKIKVAAALCFGLLAASRSYAACPEVRCPLPIEEDDPEHMTVKAPRIPMAGPTIVDLGTVVAPPIYVASVAQLNDTGKKKVEKAKQDAEAGKSTFWTTPKVAAFLAWARTLDITVNPKGKVNIDPNGAVTVEFNTCLKISVNTENKNTCSQMEASPTPDGKIRMEIRNLIAYQPFKNQYKLGYSTNDTIVLIGDSINDIISMIAEVDPRINQF
jgi:hypothetical protein